MLKNLTAMAITESEDTEGVRQLRRSLQLDGFDVSNGKTVPMEGPISVTEEKSRLLTNLAASSFPRKDVIARHLLIIWLLQQSTRCCAKTESAPLELAVCLSNQIIRRHLTDAEDLFSEGKMHPAMGQARSAFEAGVEDMVSLVEIITKRKAGSGLKNQVQFLSEEDFISADEQQAFLSAWGFLAAGAHPGLPPDEAGRIGLILGLEFMQVLLIKAKNLL